MQELIYPSAVEVAVHLALSILVAVAYVLAAWHVQRHIGKLGHALLWVTSAAVYGYAAYRSECAQPLTCDVHGPGWSFYWFSTIAPFDTIAGAAAFGAASLVLLDRMRRSPDLPLGLEGVAIGCLAAFAGWFLGTVAVYPLRLMV